MRFRRSTATITAVVMLTLLPLAPAARADAAKWYLEGGQVPSGKLASSAPSATGLPNYDPGRDAAPGLLLKTTGNGANETDPSKYQQWARDVSGMTVSVRGFTIWAAPEEFAKGESVELSGYLMECGNGCEVLDTASATVRASPEWRQVQLSLVDINRTYDEGRFLVVKVVAQDSSDGNLWLAYGTADYDANLLVEAVAAPTSTTTTTTKPTTTTSEATTTTTSAPTSSTTESRTTSSTMADEAATSSGTPSTTEAPKQGLDSEIAGTDDSGPSIAVPEEVADTGGSLEPALLAAPSRGSRTEVRETIDIFKATVGELEPAERLAVAFATVTENIALYWQAAVGTGGVASILLWVGLSRREPGDHPDMHADEPDLPAS